MNRSFSRDRYENINRGITIGTIIDLILEIGQETTIGVMVEETVTDQMIGMTITDQMIGKTGTDKMIGETILDKTIEGTIKEIDKIMDRTISEDIEIQVKEGRIQEIVIVTIQEKEVEIEVEIGILTDKHDQEGEHYLIERRDRSRPDPILE